MARVELIVCDKCAKEIVDGQYHVAAGVYGVDMHSNCFIDMTPFEVLAILSLDDIRFGTRDTKSPGDYSDYEKLIYSRRARQILTTKDTVG